MIDEIVSIERIESESLRYDITVVPHNNFFGNGLLVHNCQNLKRRYEEAVANNERFEVSYKLDGASFTAYVVNGDELKTGLCSRNLELKTDDSNANDLFVTTYNKYEIADRLAFYAVTTGRSIAIQCEMCGPGIQSNFEGLRRVELFVYAVYDIDARKYLLPDEARQVCYDLDLQMVPVYDEDMAAPPFKDVIDLANGDSGLYGKFREGLVFKSTTTAFSFKTISSDYLLKTGN